MGSGSSKRENPSGASAGDAREKRLDTRPAMCCDDYPGAVVLTAPSNKRLKLAAPVVYGRIAFVISPARRAA